jgi:hypothetical protein
MPTLTSTKFSDTPIISAASAAPMASDVQVNNVRDDAARDDAPIVGAWHEDFVVGGYTADAGNAGPGGDRIRPAQDAFAIDIGTSENLTRLGAANDISHLSVIVTDNKDPGLPAADAGASDAELVAHRHDGISDSGLATLGGGEVIGDFVTSGTTGTVSGSGNDARTAGFADGSSNTAFFTERRALSGAEGDGLLPGGGNGVGLTDIADGTSNTIAFASSDGSAANLLETMANDDNALFKGSVVTINASGGWDALHLFEFPQTDEADDGTSATIGAVSDGGDDARSAGITDGLSNILMVGRTDGSAANNVIEAGSVKYTMFDGADDGLLLGGNGADRLARMDDTGMHSVLRSDDMLEVGDLPVVLSDTGNDVTNGPAGTENLNGNINNIDLWVGGILDVGDVLVGFDDGVDNSNDSPQPRTAGGSTTLQADPDGQGNGIIAILIGLHTDNQGPLDSASLALD